MRGCVRSHALCKLLIVVDYHYWLYSVFVREYTVCCVSLFSCIFQSACPPQYVFIPVQYTVEFRSEQCRPTPGSAPPLSSPIMVAVPAGSTAVDVMAGAIDIDKRYKFQATSFGATLGFSVGSIGGTANSDDSSCYWSFYVKTATQPEATLSNVGISHFSICSEMSIIFRYSFFGSCNEDNCV